MFQIKRYFVSFWNGVDLRYRLLKGPKIRISIAGIIISRVSELVNLELSIVAHAEQTVERVETRNILRLCADNSFIPSEASIFHVRVRRELLFGSRTWFTLPSLVFSLRSFMTGNKRTRAYRSFPGTHCDLSDFTFRVELIPSGVSHFSALWNFSFLCCECRVVHDMNDCDTASDKLSVKLLRGLQFC